MQDSDVREDATLQGLIRAEIQRRRAELEQKSRVRNPSEGERKSRSEAGAAMPEAIPEVTAAQVHTEFNQLVSRIATSLEHGDETQTSSILLKMRAMQKKHPELITAETIAEYDERTRTLQLHSQELKDEIATMAKAVSAEHRRRHGRTTKKLLERERAITAEIERLAEAVHAFHKMACSGLASGEDIRRAETNYHQTLQSVQAHDADWFVAVVLEMADLLAEWTVPPHGAGRQIDRFLDGISAGLEAIRDQMREIDDERSSKGGPAE